MIQEKPSYHHGDLRAALVDAALAILASDEAADLSLRAVARRAGVSPGAPYRHFPDRLSLLSAVAAVGYGRLLSTLQAVAPEPSSREELASLAVAYVEFALRHPGLFRVMFAEGCDRSSAERVDAVAAITGFLASGVERALSPEDPAPMATGLWSLVHGLAFLHLDGKLDAGSAEEVAARVRSVVTATVR